MSYNTRRNFFEKAECEWRVEDDALVMRTAVGGEIRYPWKNLRRVQLSFAPTQWKPWRYVFALNFWGQPRLVIDNAYFEGIGDFRDRSAAYVPFVREALAKIAVTAPQAKVHAGYNTASYVFNVLIVVAAFLGLALVVFLLPLPLDAWPAIAFVKLPIIAALLPLFFRWLRRARPRDVAISDIPEDALPNLNNPQ